jgi:drug/metabolite transporter (DMT)-like permease
LEKEIMKNKEMRANMLLLITATIWGFAFVAQRIGAMYVGAFTFNGIRFALGSISLIPLLLYFSKKSPQEKSTSSIYSATPGGILAGLILFLGATLQQIGLTDTTAGKAAFITGLYIVLVPLFGILLKHRVHITVWLGALFAITGLYLLSVTEGFSISRGDFLQFIGAIFWTFHILIIDHLTKKEDPLKLSFVQFITCSVLSMGAALIYEKITINGLTQALIPILYGGILSVGVAYTLQVVGQKHAKASHAALILSMETVFAAIGGLLLLNERMSIRGYTGCAFMLAGILFSQLQNFRSRAI